MSRQFLLCSGRVVCREVPGVLAACLGGSGLVTKSCPTLGIPWTVACQAPLSMGFSRQEYWSGLPFPSAGDLPDPGIEPRSSALQADDLPTVTSEAQQHVLGMGNKNLVLEFKPQLCRIITV